MTVACYQCYISFYEQFATLLKLQLWPKNKTADPELHKSLKGQWEHQALGHPLEEHRQGRLQSGEQQQAGRLHGYQQQGLDE